MKTSIGTATPEELIQEVVKREHELHKPPAWELSGKYLLDLEITEMPTLVEPFIQKKGLAALAGPSDSGKSTLLRQLAVAIVNRRKDFLGFPLNIEHGSVIYVSTEDNDEESNSLFLNRMNDGINIRDGLENLRVIIDTENIVDKLDQSLSRKKADLVIIDCFHDLYGGIMNEGNKVRTFLHQYSNLITKHGCLIIFLHHEGKGKESFEPNKNNILGSQGFEAKMRLVMLLRKDQDIIGRSHLCFVKGNYLSDEHKRESYVLNWDDHGIYTNSNERVPFFELATDSRKDKKEEKIKKVKELKDQGLTQIQIGKKTGLSQSTISNYIRDYY